MLSLKVSFWVERLKVKSCLAQTDQPTQVIPC